MEKGSPADKRFKDGLREAIKERRRIMESETPKQRTDRIRRTAKLNRGMIFATGGLYGSFGTKVVK